MHAGARKGRKANRYVVSAAFVGRSVAHPFARLYVEPLASLDVHCPIGMFDAEQSRKNHPVFAVVGVIASPQSMLLEIARG